MFKRIMIAIDTSEVSKLAFKKAMALAKDQRATLCIVHIVDYASMIASGEVIDFEALHAATKEEAFSFLQLAVSKAKKQRLKVEFKLIEQTKFSLNSHVAGTLINVAKKWRTDLLILGTHAYGGISRFLLGSIADEVIRHSSIPLLLIRDKKS